MLRFAIADGSKRRPFKGGRATCPTCAGGVIAKCGTIKAHHWAHESIDDCDSWSEHIGPWHLSWQDPVEDEFVEVAIGGHRADIRNQAGTVIELQHSAISSEEIAIREDFYGDMVWVFDATERFPALPSGDHVFFSLERNQHVSTCQRQVFLDCGEYLIEVVAFTRLLDKFSGYGQLRSRKWFASKYLAGCMRSAWNPKDDKPGREYADWWRGKQPWRLTDFPTKWRDPASGGALLIPKKTPYIPLSYRWRGHAEPVWAEIISAHPQIANGWEPRELNDMLKLLAGMPMIIRGSLRVMPARPEHNEVAQAAPTIQRWLEKAQGHMAAGRIPILRPETQQLLLEKVKQRQVDGLTAGVSKDVVPKERSNPQRGLFD